MRWTVLDIWRNLRLAAAALVLAALGASAVAAAQAGSPTAADALKLQPLQNDDVDCDRPTGEEVSNLSVASVKDKGLAGWVLQHKNGQILRRFLDTNGDNKLDQWCYYKDGVEVYRDVDGDFNGKADQYRWLGTAGIRWALDRDEDGRVDAWKMISPEEVTAEVVAAVRNRDKARFARLLITAEELKSLGIGAAKEAEIAAKMQDAESRFEGSLRAKRVVGSKAQWVNFGGSQPGVLPASVNGPSKDLIIYDNVAAVVEENGKHEQLVIGTLVRVADVWRLLDVPTGLNSEAANTGYFFNAAYTPRDGASEAAPPGISDEVREIVAQMDKLEQQIQRAASDRERTALHDKRADLLEKLINASSGADRDIWIRQFADLVSAAAQSGGYAAGVQRLQKLLVDLKEQKADAELTSHIAYLLMSAEYAVQMQQPDADYAKIQEAWLANLEQFITAYPSGDDAADATLQLAIAKEFAGQEKDALTYYSKIARDFEQSSVAAKATGAKRRLESIGRSIEVEGPTLDGKRASLTQLRGKVVLIHYWATWCEPCKKDMEQLKNLQAKYARNGFALLGVNLDSEKEEAVQFLSQNRLPWSQLYEPGGLDSRLANELGILSLPTMMLVDQQGRVVNRSLHVRDLDDELAKLFKSRR